MPPPPPPSKSYHLVIHDSDSEEETELRAQKEAETHEEKYERIRGQVEAARLEQQQQEASKGRMEEEATATTEQEDDDDSNDGDNDSVITATETNNRDTDTDNDNHARQKKKKKTKKRRRNKKKLSTGSATSGANGVSGSNKEPRETATSTVTSTTKTAASPAAHTITPHKSVRFSQVSIREYTRCLGTDVVPGDGGWPLGIDEPIRVEHTDNQDDDSNHVDIDIDSYELRKQARLRERAIHKGLQFLVESAGDQNPTTSSTNDIEHIPPIYLETRQWDYKRSCHKNPLFTILHEEARMNLLLAASSETTTTTHPDEQHHAEAILSSSPDKHHHSHNTDRLRKAKSSADSQHHHNTRSSALHRRTHSAGSSSHANIQDNTHHHHGRERAHSFSQTLEHYNDTYTQVMVHHVRNELEDLRFKRSGEGHVGCTCRKLKVYIPPPGAGKSKKAHHRRLAPKRVVDELKKRNLLPTKQHTREELELLLHDAVQKEACCDAYTDCPCRKNGVECQADVCSCWHESHLTVQDKKHADHSSSVPVEEIQRRCGNPNGMYAVDLEHIHQNRLRILKKVTGQRPQANGENTDDDSALWQCHVVTARAAPVHANDNTMELE